MPKNRLVRALDLRKTASPAPANLSGTAAPVTGGGTTAHALSGPLHTGQLAQSQAPWAATAAALTAHAADPNAHHARLHSILSASDHSVSATAGQVLGAATGTTLGWLTPAFDVSGGASSLLRSEGGDLALRILSATKVQTPLIDSPSGQSLDLDPANNLIRVMASSALRSENWASQATGWGISYAGGADFRSIFADEMHAKSFIADLEQALAGGQIISKSVAVVAVDFSVPAPSATATLRVKDLPSAANMAVFQSGDLVRLRTFSRASGALTIANAWGVVTSYADQSDGTQTWTFTRSASPNHGAISTGTVIAADALVLDYGNPSTGGGYWEVNAIDGTYGENSPYAQVAVWATHPVADLDLRVRMGNLKGITGAAEYGLWAGQVSGGNVKITGSAVQLRQGTDAVISLNSDGSSRFDGPMTLGTGGGIYQGTGTFASPTTGLKLWRDSGVGRIGGYNGGALQWYGATDGKLYFGGGEGVLDAMGLWFDTDPVWAYGSTTNSIRWRDGSTGKAAVFGEYNSGTTSYAQITMRAEDYADTLPYVQVRGEESTILNQGSILLDAGHASLSVTSNNTDDIGTIYLNASEVRVSHAAPTLNVGSNSLSTGAATVQIGHARTGSGFAALDLVGDTTYSDYGLRLIRGNAGANATSQLLHKGTGNFSIQAEQAANLVLQTAGTTRMTVESTGDVDVVNTLRAAALRADLTSGGSGVAATITFTAESYLSVAGGGGAIKMANANSANNAGWVKMYIGTTVYWFPVWTTITP